ncbi:MAG: DUF2062 domain-containing protein [Planctomycetota bacterium]|nr:DUF2062 domain-containing protein [Planctomycetota bacterium]
MLYQTRIRLRRILRKILGTGDPPERVARGLAAGFFATAFPLPGFQIPLSVLFAWIVRGNKVVSIFPQFLSNAATMLPLAYLQYEVGSIFWPGTVAHVDQALAAVRTAGASWQWSAPLESLRVVAVAIAGLGTDVLGPLALGVLLTGLAAAIVSYPISLVAITLLHRRRLRKRLERGIAQPPRELVVPEAPVREAADTAALMRYAVDPETFVRADSVKLLVDGRAAYPEMLACIQAARQSVDMETYILRADKTGQRFAEALSAAAKRGAQVRLLYDGIGSMGLSHDYVQGLLQAGVRVAVYRPLIDLWRIGLERMNRRDHRKILVVDGMVAFTGGLNIGDEFVAKEEGGEGWRDTHLRLEGATPAAQLRDLTEAVWARATLFPVPAHAAPAPAADGRCASTGETPVVRAGTDSRRVVNVPVQVVSNKEFLQRVRVRRAYLHAIKHARRYILIENAYFIPDGRIRRALRHAVRRGVTVAVVVAQHSDIRIVGLASHALYNELLASGVRIYEYPISMLHCKAAVIDDMWSVVSSYNLDHRSLRHNLEAGVLVLDRPFATRLRKQILADVAQCREVTTDTQAARPWEQVLLESLAYQVRYWL